jgi:hypothetical protein
MSQQLKCKSSAQKHEEYNSGAVFKNYEIDDQKIIIDCYRVTELYESIVEKTLFNGINVNGHHTKLYSDNNPFDVVIKYGTGTVAIKIVQSKYDHHDDNDEMIIKVFTNGEVRTGSFPTWIKTTVL